LPVQSFDITKDVTCIGEDGDGCDEGVGVGDDVGEEDGDGCDEGVGVGEGIGDGCDEEDGVGDGCGVGEGIGVLTDDFLMRSR